MQMVFITEQFLEVAIGSWPEWDLNPQIYIYMFTSNAFKGALF